MIFSTIRTNYHRLSLAQKKVADFVLTNGNTVLYLSISELAKKCAVSEPTVLRFLKKINYDSYQVFRVEIAQSGAGGTEDYSVSEISSTDSASEIIEKIVASTTTAVRDVQKIVPAEEIDRCVEAVLDSGLTHVFGVGASAYIAGDLYHKISRLGIRATTASNEQMIALHSAHMDASDAVILVSHSGESSSVLESAYLARERSAFVCAITSYANSTLSKLADCVLPSSSSETHYRPDAMLSRIIQLVIVDVISVRCLVRMGDTGIEAIKLSQRAVARHKR